MTDWEIVAGDFGGSYRATAEGLDLSACIAKIKVWSDSTLLIDNKPTAGMTVTYADGDSYCDYVVEDGDIPLTAAVDDIVRYNVMVVFTKDGFQEHSLKFDWVVHPAPPSS